MTVLGGRDTHATTWHEITEGVDEGRVFAVNDVEIGDADTAFNLNSKCYEAGFAGFQELVQAIFGAGLNAGRQHAGLRETVERHAAFAHRWCK